MGFSMYVSLIADLDLIRQEIGCQVSDGDLVCGPRINNLLNDINDLDCDISSLYSNTDSPTWPVGYYYRLK